MNLHLEKILIVEDDLQIQTFIHYALSEEGYDCIIAKTGKEALHLSACNHVDLILLDLGFRIWMAWKSFNGFARGRTCRF